NLDLAKDFSPIALLASQAAVLVVNPESSLHSVGDVEALAKQKAGELLCATAGACTLPPFAAERIARCAGINLGTVPYPGRRQAVNDLLGGRVALFFSPASTVVGQIAAGKLRALATASDKRASIVPDVPSMAEAGMLEFDASLWFGLLAPVGTPSAAIDKVASAAPNAMHLPTAPETLKKQGFAPLGTGPAAFGPYLRNEISRWSVVARIAGVKS